MASYPIRADTIATVIANSASGANCCGGRNATRGVRVRLESSRSTALGGNSDGAIVISRVAHGTRFPLGTETVAIGKGTDRKAVRTLVGIVCA